MRLTPPQVDFISQWIHAQDYWHCRSGDKMGCIAKTGRERVTLAALKRKGAIAECGMITDAGRAAWRKSFKETQPS